MSWFRHVPPGERVALIGVVVVILGAPTLLLGALEVPDRVGDAVAIGAVTLAIGAIGAVWRRHGAPGERALADRRTTAESDRERDRSIAISAWSPPAARPLDRLAARDVGFSLPVLLAAARALIERAGELAGPCAAAEVVGVREAGERVLVDAIVRTPTATVRAHLSCPIGAPAPAPDAIPGAWSLDRTEPDPGAPSPIAVDPGVGAARRALAVREALDPRSLEALAREISAALDAGDEPARPYLTPDGQADLAFWRAVGLPPDEGDAEWLQVAQDGWFDRIEIALGARALSLRRAAARAEAPWELWRVRRRS